MNWIGILEGACWGLVVALAAFVALSWFAYSEMPENKRDSVAGCSFAAAALVLVLAGALLGWRFLS
jgi:hypothetical protein